MYVLTYIHRHWRDHDCLLRVTGFLPRRSACYPRNRAHFRDEGLFCRDVGLFCRDIGLFCLKDLYLKELPRKKRMRSATRAPNESGSSVNRLPVCIYMCVCACICVRVYVCACMITDTHCVHIHIYIYI